MGEHAEGAIFDIKNRTYYISLEKNSLKEIKEGGVKEIKIVFTTSEMFDNNFSSKAKDLYITLSNGNRVEINKPWCKESINEKDMKINIPLRLIETLMNMDKKDMYEHLYDESQNKMNFIVNDNGEEYNSKNWFDNEFNSLINL